MCLQQFRVHIVHVRPMYNTGHFYRDIIEKGDLPMCRPTACVLFGSQLPS